MICAYNGCDVTVIQPSSTAHDKILISFHFQFIGIGHRFPSPSSHTPLFITFLHSPGSINKILQGVAGLVCGAHCFVLGTEGSFSVARLLKIKIKTKRFFSVLNGAVPQVFSTRRIAESDVARVCYMPIPKEMKQTTAHVPSSSFE